MPDGLLGTQTEPGKYEDNQIPGAADASEAYDSRYYTYRCVGAPTTKTGPHGIVTYYQADPASAQTRTEYGSPQVQSDGATTCVIVPRTVVSKTRGTRSYFQWFDFCCTVLGIGDCAVVLEFVKEIQEDNEERSVIDPLITCVTDWPKWALNRLLELVRAGVSLETARTLVFGLLADAQKHGMGDAGEFASAHSVLHDAPTLAVRPLGSGLVAERKSNS